MEILEHYHPILLTKKEICEIFRISSRTAQLWSKKYGWKREGQKYLTSSIRETIKELTA